MKYQPGQHFTPSSWYNKDCFENMKNKTKQNKTKNGNASTLLYVPNHDLRSFGLVS